MPLKGRVHEAPSLTLPKVIRGRIVHEGHSSVAFQCDPGSRHLRLYGGGGG